MSGCLVVSVFVDMASKCVSAEHQVRKQRGTGHERVGLAECGSSRVLYCVNRDNNSRMTHKSARRQTFDP